MTDKTHLEGQEEAGSATLVIDGHIAEITISNGSLNLVTPTLLRQLNRILAGLTKRPDIRCTILHGGAARAFCAGSDIKAFADIWADASEKKILFEDMVLRNLARLPMPTIAAMDGPALGGGLEIALCCDLRILRHGVKIGLPECHLGGLAANGAIRLTRLIGPSRAMELLYTGAVIESDQALEWGIVNRVTGDGSALDAAREMARLIARRGPISNRLAKSLVFSAQDGPLDAALSLSTVHQQAIFDSGDLQEGAAAFFAKREPKFNGQ